MARDDRINRHMIQIPSSVSDQLKRRAERNRRNLSAEICVMLETLLVAEAGK